MAGDEHSNGEAYVSDDAVLGNYAPADEYVIFNVESETIGKDKRPIRVAFIKTDGTARREFFKFITQTCIMIVLVMGGVYFIQRSYDEDATFYAAVGKMSSAPVPVDNGTSLQSRIRVVGAGTGAMKNLVAGSLDGAIRALDIRGVRVSASGGSQALIGTQVVRPGDPIWAGLQRVVFKGIDGEKMVFEDASGRSYLRNLKAAPTRIAMGL
ncbi:MAG: hypothetical protein LBD72_03530 [Puniceicoccales bacterium]|jgi:hypothetical protein|nr:hypothetical protein [Puniceicoccales bacterium]